MAFSDAGIEVRAFRTGAYWSAPEPEFAWVRHLLEHVDTEPPGVVVLVERVGEVRSAVLVEDPPVPLIHHREDGEIDEKQATYK